MQFFGDGEPGGTAMKLYPVVDELLHPVLRVAMPQTPRLVAPSADLRADARDPRRTSQRAVGSPVFVARYVPR